ncbi:MAG: hypothetical protein U0872_05650 [Planctomycetaceae bacterium]
MGEGFNSVAEWMEQYRACWEEIFDRLEDYLKTVPTQKLAQGKTRGRPE